MSQPLRTAAALFGAAPFAFALSFASPVAAQNAADAASGTAVRYVLDGNGNEARYRVREQLARIDFPSDAIGATSGVSGSIAIAADGSIAEGSSFTVDLGSIRSDSDRRDNYVRRRVFESDSFSEAVFVPHRIEGVALPLGSGEASFRVTGDLTIHGVTRPTTWEVTASNAGGAIVGTAKTRFRFADFQLTVPRVASVLSVEDDIRLEYDFRLVPETASR